MQAKDADNAALRSLLSTGEARITNRISGSETMVVNMPLSMVQTLSSSSLVNYISPDRPIASSGHLEDTTGTSLVRSLPTLLGLGTETVKGDGVGIAILDSGIHNSNAFRTSNGGTRIVANVNFTNSNTTDDQYGHGTHVAGSRPATKANRTAHIAGSRPEPTFSTSRSSATTAKGRPRGC